MPCYLVPPDPEQSRRRLALAATLRAHRTQVVVWPETLIAIVGEVIAVEDLTVEHTGTLVSHQRREGIIARHSAAQGFVA